MKNLTNLQKKKIWYSFLSVIVLAIIVVSSLFFFEPSMKELIGKKWNEYDVPTILITYGSTMFLLFRVIYFFVYEVVKHKVINKEKQIRDFIIDKSVEVIEKIETKELPMPKQKSVSNQPKKQFKNEMKIEQFTISINEDKGIFISFDKNDFTSREDFYHKLKYSTLEMLERLRKEVDKDN